MRARYIKITVWVIALITVWSLGQTYTVTNSLFVFAAAGVIPGTNIALNPNQVLVLLASMLAASILLIFGTNIYRGLRKIAARIRNGQTLAAGSAAEPRPILAEVALSPVVIAAPSGKIAKTSKRKQARTPQPQPVVVITQPKQPSKLSLLLRIANTLIGLLARNVAEAARKHFPRVSAALGNAGSTVKRAVAHELQLLGAALAICIIALFRGVQAVGRFAAAAVRKTLAFVVAAVRWTVVGVIVAGIQIAHFIARTSARFWQWLEPRLRAFDAWLGVHYNRGLETGRARVKQSASYRTGVRSWRRSLRLLAGMRDDARAMLERNSPEE